MRCAPSCATTCPGTFPARCSSIGACTRRTSSAGRIFWPRKAGWPDTGPRNTAGCGWTPVQVHIFDEETAALGAPPLVPFGLSMVAPVIMAFGSPWQKEHYLARIRENKDWWCQGYSEPGSGSDLASLKMRAQLVSTAQGDHYIVNGQKTWTTLAQYRRHDLLPGAHLDRGAQAGGHIVPADRHALTGRDGAADHHARRRALGERSVLRGREGAGPRISSAKRARAGPMPSTCSATSEPTSRAWAHPSASSLLSRRWRSAS